MSFLTAIDELATATGREGGTLFDVTVSKFVFNSLMLQIFGLARDTVGAVTAQQCCDYAEQLGELLVTTSCGSVKVRRAAA